MKYLVTAAAGSGMPFADFTFYLDPFSPPARTAAVVKIGMVNL